MREVLLACGIGEAFCAPRPVGLLGDFLADLGQVILTIGSLDMGQQGCALAHERHSTPQQVPGGTHLGGIHVGLGKIEGMTEDKGNPLFSAEVSEPGPT